MHRRIHALLPVLIWTLVLLVLALPAASLAQTVPPGKVAPPEQAQPLAAEQRHALEAIARDTWNFYGYNADIDPDTDLPRDNIGFYGAPAQGNYTSPTNIGLYLWSIVAAQDMHIINRNEALTRLSRAITTIERLRKWNGFLLSWYDTSNGHCLTGPGGTDCETTSITGQLISTVDNGWYGAGLVVARQALSETQCRDCRDLVRRVTRPAERDELRGLLRRRQPVQRHHRRADVRRLSGGPGTGGVPLWPAEHRDPHRRLYGHRHAHHARRCLVAHLAHAAHDQPAPPAQRLRD